MTAPRLALLYLVFMLPLVLGLSWYVPPFQVADEDSFVRTVLAGQPEAPKYFAVMKATNNQADAKTVREMIIARLS